jgi:hypothetical protein
MVEKYLTSTFTDRQLQPNLNVNHVVSHRWPMLLCKQLNRLIGLHGTWDELFVNFVVEMKE